MTDTLAFLLGILVTLNVLTLAHVYKKLSSVTTYEFPATDEREEEVDIPDSFNPDSGIQDHVIKRESAFDERIDTLREELDSLARVSTYAPNEFNPEVKNIPHNSINHLIKARPEVAE